MFPNKESVIDLHHHLCDLFVLMNKTNKGVIHASTANNCYFYSLINSILYKMVFYVTFNENSLLYVLLRCAKIRRKTTKSRSLTQYSVERKPVSIRVYKKFNICVLSSNILQKPFKELIIEYI